MAWKWVSMGTLRFLTFHSFLYLEGCPTIYAAAAQQTFTEEHCGRDPTLSDRHPPRQESHSLRFYNRCQLSPCDPL